jgi:hypothetical protein
MKKINEIVALVYDYGLHVPLALRLAQYFKKVYYFSQWKIDYPTSNLTEIGTGFKEITRVNNIWDVYDEVDLFVFPCVYDGDLQMHLEKMGKLVWGSREGEAMELYRWDFIQFQKKIGMDVPNSVLVKGVTELRKELYKSKEEKFVKIDATERGDIETFRYINPEITEINDILPLQIRLGMKAETANFIVQDGIKTKVETGYDGFCIDGKFPPTALFGIEAKDLGYIAEVRDYKDLPEGVIKVNEQLSPALKKYGYRGGFHTEIREGEDGGHYLIDITARAGCPPTNLMLEMWDNISECIYEGAQGNIIDMKFRAKFGIEIMMFSPSAVTDPYTLFFPNELKQWIKQPYSTVKEGRVWVIPQAETGHENHYVGSLVCIGNSFEEVVKLAEERSEKIIGHKLEINLHALDSAIEELKKL